MVFDGYQSCGYSYCQSDNQQTSSRNSEQLDAGLRLWSNMVEVMFDDRQSNG